MFQFKQNMSVLILKLCEFYIYFYTACTFFASFAVTVSKQQKDV